MTRALTHGLGGDEISDFTAKVVSHRQIFLLPTALPTLLLVYRVHSAISKVSESHSDIVVIENDTGIRTRWQPAADTSGASKRFDIIDFDRVTDDLTSLLSKLAYCEYLADVHIPMLDSLDRINSHIVDMKSKSGSDDERMKRAEARLRAENKFLRSSLQGVRFRAKFLSKRCRAQVQSVSLSKSYCSGY